jgi:cysteinyl-tRNA synthetase
VIGRTLKELRAVVTPISKVLGFFEDEPGAWLLRRRDRQVKAKELDPVKIEALIADRRAARQRKDFAAADTLRAELTALGVEIMDTPQGTTWKVIG